MQVATSDAWRGPTGQLRLFGAPPPLIFLEAKAFVALVGKTRAQVRRENESARFTLPLRGRSRSGARGEGARRSGFASVASRFNPALRAAPSHPRRGEVKCRAETDERRITHAQTELSRPAHARTVAGVAAQGARRFGQARAVRPVRIVSPLPEQTMPARAHVLRRRSGRLLRKALAPDQEKTQDAAQTRCTACTNSPMPERRALLRRAAMWLARITSPQSFISLLSSAAAASGVSSLAGYRSMPPSAKVFCTRASASAVRSAALSLSTIGRGVPAGASSMCQKSMLSFL